MIVEYVKNYKFDIVFESLLLLILFVIFGGNFIDGVVLKNMGGWCFEIKKKIKFFL